MGKYQKHDTPLFGERKFEKKMHRHFKIFEWIWVNILIRISQFVFEIIFAQIKYKLKISSERFAWISLLIID